MRLSMTLTGAPIDKRESIATIPKALDLGINLLNTVDFYGDGDNEELIAEAVNSYQMMKVFNSLKCNTFSNLMKGGNTVDVGANYQGKRP